MKKWRYLVPNSFTSLSLFLGGGSLLLSLEGNLNWAAWLILWCVLLDKADGTAARLLKASSTFGAEFDSMADLIAFGLAPAVLVYALARQQWHLQPGEGAWFLTLGMLAIYLLCAASRLIRFNIIEHPPEERYFSGVPTTVTGAIVASAVLVLLDHQYAPPSIKLAPLFMLLLGLGMISSLPVPKVTTRKNRAMNILQIFMGLGVYLCGILMIYPEYLFLVSLGYVLVGMFHALVTGAARQPATT
jgi:CDP-diacylglycerol---serine O-phosphatidyltransferase